jgi:hypothetical protein
MSMSENSDLPGSVQAHTVVSQLAAAPPPAAMPRYPGASEMKCRLCNCVPAAPVTFRQHRGLIVLMQLMRHEGPYCRYCGTEVFRDATAKTLLQGWWGLFSLFATPITILVNVAERREIDSLEPPRPPASGTYRTPLAPTRPLFRRPGAIVGAALPVLVLLLIVVGVAVG